MLRKIEITEPGDTRFLKGEQVERGRLLDENERTAERVVEATRDSEFLKRYLDIQKDAKPAAKRTGKLRRND